MERQIKWKNFFIAIYLKRDKSKFKSKISGLEVQDLSKEVI